jgi:hypothetical protein
MNKPEVKHVTFYRNEGSYNWLNSSEKSAQYVFNFPHLNFENIKEMGLKNSFLVDLEEDYDFDPKTYTALELAEELRSIFDNYWIHSDKEEIKKVYQYLESIEEEQETLRHEYEVEFTKYQIKYWEEKLTELTK